VSAAEVIALADAPLLPADGDVKLAPVIGFALGLPGGLYALALGPLLVALMAIPILISSRWSLRSRVPCGPYLAVGAGVVAVATSV
jgi:prepilin signal peptidase PulO-like enzyme (type II secretory pathway)